jgi:cationic amino acid transporter 4
MKRSCFLGVVIIAGHHQNNSGMHFKVPLVPYIPMLSIIFNIELMIHLSVLTWIRFFIWIAIGMLVYFLYGIHHSKQGEYLSTSYSLMTSTEATKNWGSTTGGSFGIIGGGTKKISKIVRGNVSGCMAKSDDKMPIIDDNDNDDMND